MKDTFVTAALEAGTRVAWLEEQTGVADATLRKHDGRWMPADDGGELRRFAALEPGLFGAAPHDVVLPRLAPRGPNSGVAR